MSRKEQIYRQELTQLIQSTPWLMSVLETVRACNPPDWLVGAGVMRNLVWDDLHQYQTPTPLADIDVIFFDPQDVRPQRDHMVQQQLARRLPHVAWEATNQAAVHLWYEEVFGFSVPALHSSEEAVGTGLKQLRVLPYDSSLLMRSTLLLPVASVTSSTWCCARTPAASHGSSSLNACTPSKFCASGLVFK